MKKYLRVVKAFKEVQSPGLAAVTPPPFPLYPLTGKYYFHGWEYDPRHVPQGGSAQGNNLTAPVSETTGQLPTPALFTSLGHLPPPPAFKALSTEDQNSSPDYDSIINESANLLQTMPSVTASCFHKWVSARMKEGRNYVHSHMTEIWRKVQKIH